MEAMIELQEEWKDARPNYDPFVEDGILDETEWYNTSPKTMFLMKESHKEADWYLISDRPIDTRWNGKRRGEILKIWQNVLRWKYAIYEAAYGRLSPDFPPLEIIPDVSERDSLLYDIAYVNVCKRLGETTSYYKIIEEFAMRDQDFLARQIDLINPDVILCAGTFNPYRLIYDSDEYSLEYLTDRAYSHRGRLVLDFSHPAPPKGNKEVQLYSELVDILLDPKVSYLLGTKVY